MNLFGFHIHISRNKDWNTATGAASAVTKALALTPEEWLRGEDVGRGAILANAYEQVVWVYRAINALAEQVANVPFLFSAGERGRENLVTSGPLLDFYSRPHPQLNRFQYWELRVIWLMLRGECFRVPVYEAPSSIHSGRRLKSVFLLDPARFQHIVEDHRLIGWRYTGMGPRAPLASQVFLPEEVWFEKLPNPFDFWRGFPPLYAAGLAASTDFAAGAFMRGIIENNADTGLIVRTNEWLGDEQREQIVAALRDRKRRAGQADRPVLLLGSAEVIRPQLSSTDLQFLENRKFSRGEICAAFGVPEEIVTTTDHAKYDVMAGARLNFIENRVAPLCSRLEAEEEVTVKAIDPLASGWFDLDSLPIMQEARRNRLTAARTGFEMGIPFNELNRVLDLGFKPLPWGERGYVAGKLTEVGRGTNAKGGERKAEVGSAEAASDPVVRAGALLEDVSRSTRSLPEWLADRPGQGSSGTGAGSVSPENAEMRRSEAQDRALEAQLTTKLRRFFFEQRGRVLEQLDSVSNGLGHLGPAPLTWLDIAAENVRLADLLTTTLLQALDPIAAPAQGQALLAEFLQSWAERCPAVNEATGRLLDESMRAGFEADEAPQQWAARVRTIFNDASARRAPELARLEAGSFRHLIQHP
jgi:HK97 family phage portal protein